MSALLGPDTLEHGAIIVSAVVAVAGAYYTGRRNRREEIQTELEVDEHVTADRNEALKVKDDLIESLAQDRTEIREQLKKALAREERMREEIAEERKAAREREGELQRSLDDLRKRMGDMERESRLSIQAILEAVVTSDRCLKANTGCLEREIPGDRRVLDGSDLAAAGGTD